MFNFLRFSLFFTNRNLVSLYVKDLQKRYNNKNKNKYRKSKYLKYLKSENQLEPGGRVGGRKNKQRFCMFNVYCICVRSPEIPKKKHQENLKLQYISRFTPTLAQRGRGADKQKNRQQTEI